MSPAIKVDAPFHSAHDTARLLGVSPTHAQQLIARAKRLTQRYRLRNEGASVVKGRAKGKSATTAARKSSGRNAGTKTLTAKAKAAKAKR